ncbi:MAG: endonuclease [Gemmataceae bacterium]|nr:endonuclease [Gemmataceae bacterium]
MATTTSKQKIVHQLFTALGKHLKTKPLEARPVLEQFVYAILRENATRESADQAFASLQEHFFDWNEVRVSSTLEIVEALDGIVADAETRAQRIVDFLQEIFETTYSFDLEPLLEVLQKKGLKLASKQLARYQAANEYAVTWVIQQSLGGHAIPLDAAAIRALKRMGLAEESGDLESLRTSIEHQVPKAKGLQFVDLLSVLTDVHCHEDQPACSRCPLRQACPTGLESKHTVAATSKKPR